MKPFHSAWQLRWPRARRRAALQPRPAPRSRPERLLPTLVATPRPKLLEGKAGIRRTQASECERKLPRRAHVAGGAPAVTRRQIDANGGPRSERTRLGGTRRKSTGPHLRGCDREPKPHPAEPAAQISSESGVKEQAPIHVLVKGPVPEVVLSVDTMEQWAAQGLDLTSPVIERLNAQPAAPAPTNPEARCDRRHPPACSTARLTHHFSLI